MSAFPPSVNRAGSVILTVHGVKKTRRPRLKKKGDINNKICDKKKDQKLLVEQAGHKMASRLLPAVFTHASSAA